MKLLRLGGGIVSAAAVCALLLPGAASATPATFSSTGPLVWQLDGQMKVSMSGAQWTCTSANTTFTFNGQSSAASNAGTPTQGTITFLSAAGGGCNSGGPVSVYMGQSSGAGASALTVSSAAGAYTLAGPDMGVGFTSFGFFTWLNGSFQAQWVNGTSTANPSVVVFNNTVVGTSNGQPVKLTGRFKVTIGGSGLITAS